MIDSNQDILLVNILFFSSKVGFDHGAYHSIEEQIKNMAHTLL